MIYILNDTDIYLLTGEEIDLSGSDNKIVIFCKNIKQPAFSGEDVLILLKFKENVSISTQIEILEAENKEEQLFLIGGMVINSKDEELTIINIPVNIPARYQKNVNIINTTEKNTKPKRKRRTKAEIEKEKKEAATKVVEIIETPETTGVTEPPTPKKKAYHKPQLETKEVPETKEENKIVDTEKKTEKTAVKKEIDTRSMKEKLLARQKEREAIVKPEEMDAEEKRRLEFDRRKKERKESEKKKDGLVPEETEEEIIKSLEEDELPIYNLLKVKSSDIGYTWPTNMLIFSIISMADEANNIEEFESAMKFSAHGDKLFEICKPHLKTVWEKVHTKKTA